VAQHLECLLQTILPHLIIIPGLPDDEGVPTDERAGTSLETRLVVRGRVPCFGTYLNLASGHR
jgi:hypothetical protein